MNAADPKSFNLPDGEMLRPDNLDNVARALLSLLREVAVLNDRVLTLEQVLEDEGIAVKDKIEGFEPDEAFDRMSDEAMQRVMTPVITSLRGADGGD